MNARTPVFAAAIVAACSQLPLTALAQAATGAAPVATSAIVRPPAPAGSPADWIEYDDLSYTPVIDDVSTNLAAARAALASKDPAKAADAMRAAARALQLQGDKVATLERQRAAADLRHARDTHARMMALSRQLDTTAEQIKAGKLPTTAALDQTLGKAARSDLERRWLVTDLTTWYPLTAQPQQHFGAALEAFAKKDGKTAAVEVRKAEAYVRLEAARATGEARQGLDATRGDLEKLAQALDKGSLKTEKDLDRAFANADHALAIAHRADAAESWARKAHDRAGYELKAAAQDLDNAATWTGTQAKAAATAAAADARAVGDKLASGGVWSKDEVAKGFDSLRSALNRLGLSIGAKHKASSFDVGA